MDMQNLVLTLAVSPVSLSLLNANGIIEQGSMPHHLFLCRPSAA